MGMTLALIFMALGLVVARSRRVSAAESWILFLAGVFFWASGIGSSLWVLVDAIYHTLRGH
jgi:fucose permease